MIIVLPKWYSKAEKKIQDAIDSIVREEYIDWTFAHDSATIDEAKNDILNVLVRIYEQVHNPMQPTKEEAEKLKKAVREHGKQEKLKKKNQKGRSK